jgi:hypothetical protein
MHNILEPANGTTLPASLVAAYQATEYRVQRTDSYPGLTLLIGVAHADLMVMMKRHACQSAAFITAFNPLGKALSDVGNQARHLALRQVLRQRSLPHWPGIGQGTGGDWPGEESFLLIRNNLT